MLDSDRGGFQPHCNSIATIFLSGCQLNCVTDEFTANNISDNHAVYSLNGMRKHESERFVND